MAERIRIQKAIADSGLMSRRKAEDAIRRGRVEIDGRTALLGDRVDVESETLLLDGVPIPVDPALETHLLYKPLGVVSTAADPQGRPTVVDLVETTTRLYPVGRLDADSEGLILLSNDGSLTNRVTHPRYGVEKTYLVEVEGTLTRRGLRQLINGVELEDGLARAHRARIVESVGGRTLVEMVMGEGRNREIRRMMSGLGNEVIRLVRTAVGPISDRTLKPGESRLLNAEEVRALFEASEI